VDLDNFPLGVPEQQTDAGVFEADRVRVLEEQLQHKRGRRADPAVQ